MVVMCAMMASCELTRARKYDPDEPVCLGASVTLGMCWELRQASDLRTTRVASNIAAEATLLVPVLRPAQLRCQQACAQPTCFVAPFRLRKPSPSRLLVWLRCADPSKLIGIVYVH